VKKSKQKENNKCTLYGVVLSAFRPDIENWGLGTYIYVYLLYWCAIVGLIKLAYYLFS
jgi:hypothetical protein